jgi:RNA recognition motif-containing protein
MDSYYQDVDMNSNYYEQQPFHNNEANRLNASIGATVSVTPTARMKTYGVPTVPQQTRHARRIYVGGIPPNYIDEDSLRSFLNSVIAQGLCEENDCTYVLSVYINQKKCFAFVELKSIELASACLELDGIILKNVVLRILRANEYKPELIPQSLNKAVRFDLSGFQFGSISNGSSHPWSSMDSEEPFQERTLESVIQFTNLGGLEPGSVTIVGFPFDDSQRKTTIRGTGCAGTPKQFRAFIRKHKYGFVDNPEFEVDISKIKVLDVGDVLSGKTIEESKSNLTTTVTELVLRGSVPFVVGGSIDMSSHSISGLLSSSGNKIASIFVSAHADIRMLDDPKFLGSRSPAALPNCHGRFVVFGAQVNLSVFSVSPIINYFFFF